MTAVHTPSSLGAQLQRRLERFYQLDALPSIDGFAFAAANDERETVFVHHEPDDDVALGVRLPTEGLVPPTGSLSFDTLCQIIEGVSHFIYLAERIRINLPTTHLELELQAEVDKFVILAFHAFCRQDWATVAGVHTRLYHHATFLHAEGSEHGHRYRLANHLAAKFCGAMRAQQRTRALHVSQSQAALQRFYRAGQREKIHLAQAA